MQSPALVTISHNFLKYVLETPYPASKRLLKLASHASCSIIVLANTSRPRHNQLRDISYATLVQAISNGYKSTYTPNFVWPASLLLCMVHISHLRYGDPDEPPLFTPAELLEQISLFSATEWAHSIGDGSEELQSLGLIYQSAVVLYCILSLQSASILRENAGLDAGRIRHYERLLPLLRTACLSPQLRMLILWPFCVAGVAAVRGSDADRQFISERLWHMNKTIGHAMPGILRDMLHKFWLSGNKAWDGCFERQYCFI